MKRDSFIRRLLAAVLAAVMLLVLCCCKAPGNVAPDNNAAPENVMPDDPNTPEPAEPSGQQDPLDIIISGMTLREKICQMLIVPSDELAGLADETESPGFPAGGVVFTTEDMQTREQFAQLCAKAQVGSAIPLLMACTEEGGRVSRLMSALGSPYIGPMLSYRGKGAEKAFENARAIAQDMRSFGLNLDFSPVADVWSNPKNSVIGDRAYSTDHKEAAELVSAAVKGFHEGGIACTLKHFPGHGDTAEDSHKGTAVLNKTLDELRSQELLPFKAGIEAGADAVMIGHITLPAAAGNTDLPADVLPVTFSRRIVTDLLRGELGFEGVIITDALEMKAISDHYTPQQAAVLSVNAGVDMLLSPADTAAAVDALTEAVESGQIPESRINDSVRRILELKQKLGLVP